MTTDGSSGRDPLLFPDNRRLLRPVLQPSQSASSNGKIMHHFPAAAGETKARCFFVTT